MQQIAAQAVLSDGFCLASLFTEVAFHQRHMGGFRANIRLQQFESNVFCLLCVSPGVELVKQVFQNALVEVPVLQPARINPVFERRVQDFQALQEFALAVIGKTDLFRNAVTCGYADKFIDIENDRIQSKRNFEPVGNQFDTGEAVELLAQFAQALT